MVGYADARPPGADSEDLAANYVLFKAADECGGSIDMATALHPQTLLAAQPVREDLDDPLGYPSWLQTSITLRFRKPKWITVIEITNEYRDRYQRYRRFNRLSGN